MQPQPDKNTDTDSDTPVIEHAIFRRSRKTEVKVKNSMTSTRRKPRLPTVYNAAEISIFCVYVGKGGRKERKSE